MPKYNIRYSINYESSVVVEAKDRKEACEILVDDYDNGSLEDWLFDDPDKFIEFDIKKVEETDKPRQMWCDTKEKKTFINCFGREMERKTDD